ncbi:MAG: FkbM family methyltransferase [Neomegalonema sp.]|nr:FkbM family methyltransferase [Neomegalonema sp.]
MELRNVTIGGEPAKVAVQEVYSGRFWDQVSAGDWEPETFAFLRAHLGPDRLLLDIGAWIGPIALFAARRGARVIALEPDPTAWAELSHTVAANPGLAIDIRQQAVAEKPGRLQLFATKDGFGSSETTAVAAAGAGEPIEAATVPLETLAAEARPGEQLVVKIDIEGFEFALAEQIATLVLGRKAPTLLSLHPSALYKSARAQNRSDAEARADALETTRSFIARFDQMDLRPVRRPEANLSEYLQERMTSREKGPRDFEVAITPRA